MADFDRVAGGISGIVPASIKKYWTFPTPVSAGVRGRVELCIGRLGAGKTTWAAQRCRRLALATDRKLATTGIGWPDEWRTVHSLEQLLNLEDHVLLWDEVHLLMPSVRPVLTADEAMEITRSLSLLRKRNCDVVATTQAWTRVATGYRQLVTQVWRMTALKPGRLHVAWGHDHPDEGGKVNMPAQYFSPRAAKIPTNAVAWMGEAVSEEWARPRPAGPTTWSPGPTTSLEEVPLIGFPRYNPIG